MKRLLLILLCTGSLSARVLSYSPYTDRLSARGDQLRTSRHFVLIELDPWDQQVKNGQVVLYDSKAIDPPRVIFPRGSIYFAALYQDRDDLPPVVLIATESPRATHISRNGGRTWRRIPELDGLVPHQPRDVDYGGPWTRGLSASVRIGTRGFPFVVSYRGAVYAIPRVGTPRLLVKTLPTVQNQLLGQNREGTEFVIRTGRHSLAAVGLDGSSRPIGQALPDMDAAWITPDGFVYAVVHQFDEWRDGREDWRELYLYRNGQPERVSDPYRKTVVVPTHDFGGAWIASMAWRGGDTILWRHWPDRKAERMWGVFDEDAPDIEALHTGASGKNVLIQVHRPRAVQTEFVDPALAVWRVGDPAPAEYDELFLREGPYKGFVHLDVDKLAEGDPFVFDSSFVLPPPPEPVSPPLSGGGDIMQEWGVVRGSLKQRLVIPGAIRAPGQWFTDLTIYNPLATPQQVAVTFAGVTRSVTIGASEIRVFCDALNEIFGIDEESGTLHLEPEVGVNAAARVYTIGGGGMRGYTIGAIDFFNVASPRFPVTFAGAFPGGGFRTRLLLSDTTGGGLTADVTTATTTGTIGTSTIAAVTASDQELPSPGTGALIVRPATGTGIAGVVVVDERSGDPTYFPPDIPSQSPRTIPYVVHRDDLRTDLHLLNFSDRNRSVELQVTPYGGGATRWQTYVLRPFESRVIVDPLHTVFGLTGVARLRYWSYGYDGDTTGVRVTSRAYRMHKDGGTSGTLVPALNNFQSVTGNESLEILAPVANGRVTLGLLETSAGQGGRTMSVKVSIYDDRSRLITTFDRMLALGRGEILEDLFGQMNADAPPAARIVVEPQNNSGLVTAFALIIDPLTEDTTFIAPMLGAKK